MLAKRLNLKQVITDGGSYSLDDVYYLIDSTRKPSLATFAKIPYLRRHRSLKRAPLCGPEHIYVDLLTDENLFKEQLDDRATEHLNHFWGNYNIKLAYKLEHKIENIFTIAAYWGKSNYAFQVYDPETTLFDKTVKKIRGQREFYEGNMTPYYRLFDYMMEAIPIVNFPLEYKNMQLLSIGNWRQKMEADPEFKTRPGDAFITNHKLRFNNSEMPFDFVEAFNEVDKRTRNPDRVLFESLLDKGIRFTHDQMIWDNLMVNEKSTKKREKLQKEMDKSEFLIVNPSSLKQEK